MARSAAIPLAFGGIASILIISGIQGESIAEVLKGEFGSEKGKPFPDPAFKGNGTRPSLQTELTPPSQAGGIAYFDGKPIASWILPILVYARAHGWKGTVTSGYRTREEQQRIYNSGVKPAAQPGTSNHERTKFPGGAVDVTEARELSEILANSPYRGQLSWAGNKDPVHFSHPEGGTY